MKSLWLVYFEQHVLRALSASADAAPARESMTDGPAAGLTLIDAILERGSLLDYHLADAARADLLPASRG